MPAGNIFFDVHDTLWDLLEAKTAFTSQVLDSPATRIKFTGADREPIQAMASSADYPKVMIWCAGSTVEDRKASNATHLTLQWEVLVHSGEQPFDPFFELQWAVFAALINWDDAMKAIGWGSEFPAVNCDITGSRDSLLGSSRGTDLPGFRHHNMRGWGSIWVGKTDCWFSHANLQAVS